MWKQTTGRLRMMEQSISRAFRLCQHMPHSKGEHLSLGWSQWRSFVSKQRMEEIEAARIECEEQRYVAMTQRDESLKAQQAIGLQNAELERLRVEDQCAIAAANQLCAGLKQSLALKTITIQTGWVNSLVAKTFGHWQRIACQRIMRRLGQSVAERRGEHERAKTMRHTFLRWTLLLNWGHERRHLFEEFQKRFVFRYMYKVFKSWKGLARQRVIARRLSVLMMPRFSDFRLNLSMFAWKLYAKHRFMQRRVLLPVLTRLHLAQLSRGYSVWRYTTFVISPSDGNFVRQHLRVWHLYSVQKRRYRAISGRIARSQELRLKARCFHAVFDYVALLREQQQKIAQVLKKWHTRGVREALRKMRTHTHSCLKRAYSYQERRIEAHMLKIGGLKIQVRLGLASMHTSGCLEFFFRHWSCEKERLKRRRRIVQHYTNKAYLRTLQIALRRWDRNMKQWHGDLQDLTKALRHDDRRTKQGAFRELYRMMRDNKSRRGAQYKVVQHFQNRHQRRAWRSWNLFVQDRRRDDTMKRVAGMAPSFTRWCINVSRRKIARRVLRRLLFKRIKREFMDAFRK
jgi:hypothetical protein